MEAADGAATGLRFRRKDDAQSGWRRRAWSRVSQAKVDVHSIGRAGFAFYVVLSRAGQAEAMVMITAGGSKVEG